MATAAPAETTSATSAQSPVRAVSGVAPIPLRLGAAALAVAVLAVLLVAATLRANTAGHGTHTQLGLPKCGFVVATGKPCPTCGMTTAFTHAAHGRFAASFLTQPGGLVACLAAAAFMWPCLHTALTGSRALELCGKLLTPKALWIAAGVWLGSWAYTFLTWTNQ